MGAYQKVKLGRQVKGLATGNETNKVRGIILPHHELAKEFIISSLETISQNQNFSYIVLIGTNHYQPESSQFISSISLHDAPIAEEIVYKLEDSQEIILDSEAVKNDHSITTSLPYLKYYFPQAMFIPILAPAHFDDRDIVNLSATLKEYLPENTLYVASVDFSHGKMVLEAMEKNRETENAIKNFDYRKIYTFKDDHLDSPSSIGLLLQTMQQLGATKWQVWYDSHGAFIEDNYSLQGTSYLVGVFTR